MNKRIVATLIAVSLLTALLLGCAAQGMKTLPDLAEKYGIEPTPKASEQPSETPASKTAEPIDSKAFDEFKVLLTKNASPAELIAYIKANGKGFSVEQEQQAATELLKRIEIYYEAQLDKFNKLQETSTDLYDLNEISYTAANRVENEPIDKAEADYLNELIDNGLMFYFTEGLSLDLDAAGFLSLFPSDFSGEAADYMRIALAEQQDPSMAEGMSQISEKEMVDRCESVLNYLEKYADSPFADDAKQYLVDYYRAILVQSFSLFDYETGKVVPERKEMLEAYAAAARGTKVEPVMNEYLALLEKEGWKKTKAVEEYLVSLGFSPDEVAYN